MSYLVVIVLTLMAWVVGLFLDANLTNGDMAGFLELRIILPMLTMGILNLKRNK